MANMTNTIKQTNFCMIPHAPNHCMQVACESRWDQIRLRSHMREKD